MGSLAFTLGLVGFSALGVEYTPAWLHVQEFIERAEQALSFSDRSSAEV
jgi:hypothetical protein